MAQKLLFSILCIFFLSNSLAQDLVAKMEEALSKKDSTKILLDRELEDLQTKRDSGLYLYFLGRYQRRIGERKEAVQSNLKALQLLSLEKDPQYYIEAYNQLTYLESILGDWEKAMLYGQKALESARIAGDSNKMAYSLADISIVYHDMEQYDKGVEFSKNGLKIISEYSDPNPKIKAFVLNAIAINFDDWNQPDSALYYHYQVLDLYPIIDSMEFTNTYNNVGNTLLKQGKYADAKKWVDLSLKYNLIAGDFYKIATNFNNLATIAYNLGDFQKAEVLMDSTYKYVLASESREKLRDYLYDQFRFQRKKGDLVKAIDYLEQYSELKDSIFKEDRVRMIGEIQTLYEVEAKERELAESRAALAEQELQSKSRDNLLLILLLGLILVLGSSFFVYYRQKNLNRHLEQEAKLQAVFAEQETQKKLQEQRNRISSDLHDNIGAQLTFIVSSLDHLKFADLSKDKIASKLDQVSSFTVDTINELRDTIWAMNKAQVTLEDLENRLSALLQKARISCPKIEFDLQIEDSFPYEYALNSLEGINLYRIAQEALNNAIKHADATRIEIKVTEKNGSVQLVIQDNGRGLPENPVEGNGLQTMKTRASRIGKELIVNSESGEGTQIIVS